MNAFADLFGVIAALGLLQCFAGLIAVVRFSVLPNKPPSLRPPVTVLKPLCGDEPMLEEAVVSCCRQIYPSFQIVFGIQNPSDPALAVVRRVQRQFPDCDISVVVDGAQHGPNRKVANLINMMPYAKHDVLVISDSDLHVPPNYLERLVAELEKPGTGMVTSLYVGLAPAELGWTPRLGATQISHGFLPGVLLSRALGREDCLGSTAMLHRKTLERIGGLYALVDLLAEDNVMGQRVRDLGLSIRLGNTIPAATVPEPDFHALWQHEMRWTRTICGLAPVAICASTIQYPLFWAVMALVFSGCAPWAGILFAAAWLIRALTVRTIDHALRPLVGRAVLTTPVWLLPIRDSLTVFEIFISYWIGEVVWRGHKIGANCSAALPAGFSAVPYVTEELSREG